MDFQVRLVQNNREMIDRLRAGEVDLIMDTPFSALTYERDTGAQLLLRAWKGGVPSYRSGFFTRDDSSIRTLADQGGAGQTTGSRAAQEYARE